MHLTTKSKETVKWSSPNVIRAVSHWEIIGRKFRNMLVPENITSDWSGMAVTDDCWFDFRFAKACAVDFRLAKPAGESSSVPDEREKYMEGARANEGCPGDTRGCRKRKRARVSEWQTDKLLGPEVMLAADLMDAVVHFHCSLDCVRDWLRLKYRQNLFILWFELLTKIIWSSVLNTRMAYRKCYRNTTRPSPLSWSRKFPSCCRWAVANRAVAMPASARIQSLSPSSLSFFFDLRDWPNCRKSRSQMTAELYL